MNGSEVAAASGASKRQIYKWIQRGWLRADKVAVPYWAGFEFQLSAEEARVAEEMAALTRVGIHPEIAHALVRGNVAQLDSLLKALVVLPTVYELRYRLWGGRQGTVEPAVQNAAVVADGESEPPL